MAIVTATDRGLEVSTSYNPAFVAELKAQIPSSDRQFDRLFKLWIVAPKHSATIITLIQRHYGVTVRLDVGAAVQQVERRTFQLDYIGIPKQRGTDSERTAFGSVGGEWLYIFSETVLRQWFHAPAKPQDELTLYARLGLSNGATAAEIKTAFRRLALQWHPDHCHEDGAADQFKAIKAAYGILANDQMRRRYDAGLALAASLPKSRRFDEGTCTDLSGNWRPPLRCGIIVADCRPSVGRFVVENILAWTDVLNARGETMTTYWPRGADTFTVEWI